MMNFQLLLQENFRWNGVINKKNGQKTSSSQRNEINELNKESSEMSSAEKITHCNGSIDFAKLPSLSDTPKVSLCILLNSIAAYHPQ